MKKILLSIIIAASILGVRLVKAQEQPTAANTNASDSSQRERLEKNRQMYPIALNDGEKSRIVERCQIAQEGLRKISTALANTITARTTLYASIDTKLSALQKRLLAQELDTSIIDLLLASYRKDVDNFKTSANNYHVALEDAITMGCQAEPELFRSQLEAVRAARKEVADSASRIRGLIMTDLKTSIDSLKLKLKTTEQ